MKMSRKFIKNIDFSKALDLAGLVDYQPGRVVSLTLVQNEALSMTLFAFAKGEGVSTHSAPGDAMVYIIDGQAEITIGGEKLAAAAGQTVVMPADIPHGLEATEDFKMLLILVKQ
jgi:quercetin dioxygenase-like cupin family protein